MEDDMKIASEEMLEAFKEMYNAMPNEQRLGVIALASLIEKWKSRAGYKIFCRALVQRLKDGELKLN